MKRVLLLLAVTACSKVQGDDKPKIIVTHDEVHVAAAVPAGELAWKNVEGAEALPAFAKDAMAAHLRPYAYLHASWCGPCNAIEKTHAADPKMAAAFKGTAIALIDIDVADPKSLDAAGLRSGSIPVFWKLDASGKPTGDEIDGGAWGDNIPDNMAPPLAAFFAK